MAHYALLNDDNIVTDVIVGTDENTDGLDWEQEYSKIYGKTCVRTSYNTYGNIHVSGGTPFRKNYAVVGGIYDPIRDAFYTQQPHQSWTLDEDTCLWNAPTPAPDDNFIYVWDEDNQVWEKGKSKQL